MATDTGPPTGTLKLMTPFQIAPDPPTPKPIPDLLHPDKSPAERATERFSLAGKRAIGRSNLSCLFELFLDDEHDDDDDDDEADDVNAGIYSLTVLHLTKPNPQ